LWGTESDSSEEHFAEIASDELEQLKDMLLELGFPADEIEARRHFAAGDRAAARRVRSARGHAAPNGKDTMKMKPATAALIATMNMDIARIQAMNAQSENERLERARRLAAEQDAKFDDALGQGRN
jgi:hypothetical protein